MSNLQRMIKIELIVIIILFQLTVKPLPSCTAQVSILSNVFLEV